MGLGDVKLMGGVGAFLGWDGALLTFFVGCVSGAIGGIVHKVVTKDSYIAFGPFLVVYALGARPSGGLAIAMVLAGVAVVLVWRLLGWDQAIVYEAMPGMLSGILVFVLAPGAARRAGGPDEPAPSAGGRPRLVSAAGRP